MSAHPPPVPPANQTTKGPGPTPAAHEKSGASERHGTAHENVAEQGETANVKQNQTHPGSRQAR